MFGPYRLESLLGRGGMGEVHRAYDTVRGRVVALKRLPPALASDVEFQARFRKEAALAARLHEPHIIPIHDYGEIDGVLYIDMRLVEGSDLAELLAAHGPLSARRAVHVVAQVAAALDVAHAQDLVHRDIKPGHVLVTPGTIGDAGEGEFVYVADFGIARAMSHGSTSLTATGATVGSLDYMAPERFTDGHGDHRVDVYSLGCLLFEALTARRPFPGEGLPAMVYAHLHTPPPRPSELVAGLPPGLDDVVAKAMAKDPADRYAGAGELALAARAALAASAGDAGAATLPERVAARGSATTDLPTDVVAAAALPSAAAEPPPSVPPVAAAGPPPSPAASDATAPVHGAAPGPTAPAFDVVVPATPSPAPPARRRGLLVAAVLVLAVLAGLGGALAFVAGPAEIVTEPVRTAGDNPFMPPVGDDRTGVKGPVGAGGTFSGGTSGLYGGTLNDAACDPEAMIAFLQRNPGEAAAWAQAQGIAPSGLAGYLRGLTPALLRSDTAVTNHGFTGGAARPFPSVLQAGTAVLVDEYGVPRARCSCGNPLTPPAALSQARYTGPSWPDFTPAGITVIERAAVVIDTFTIVDPVTGETFERPRGTAGSSDLSRTPVAVPPTTQAPAPPVQQRPATPAEPPAPPAPPGTTAAPPPPQSSAPRITGTGSYQEGVLIYARISFADADGDAAGFGFNWIVPGQGELEGESHPFTSPSFGRVSPGRVDYPFNHDCGGANQYESDVRFVIYDSEGNDSRSVIVHLACAEGGAG
ncbi:MAG: DUF6777 domain-containing protein [Pseudonocardia sp.]